MDLQSGIVAAYNTDPNLLARAGAFLDCARSVGLAVVHVKVGFRPGVPEIHSRNMLLGTIKNSPMHQKLFEGELGAIHHDVVPQPEDLIVTKSRVNAFAGTDLALLLRAKEIHTLILFGIATSGVVLSTALSATDDDYRLFVVKDCCHDMDPTVHDFLIQKVFPRFATVLSSEEMERELGE
jgi:nicotinamidase-related amidase